jgi:AcrR family transcriptional regulator
MMNDPQGTYQYQHSLHRKTRNALVTTALALISEKGLASTNMIEIADRARVSRASLYNHFRDKNEVFLAVLELELERIINLSLRTSSVSERLFIISREISSHPAIAKVVSADPGTIATILANRESVSWVKIYQGLASVIAADATGAAIVLRWLVGQVFLPLSEEHSRTGAAALARAIN